MSFFLYFIHSRFNSNLSFVAARSSIERSLQDSLPTTDSRGIVVSGQKVKVDQKGQTAPSRPLSSKAAGKVQQQKGKAAPKPRIRNYNLRDSSDFR